MENEKHIRLLDCTLRDGGHINEGIFGEQVIRNTISKLVEAGIDIIEVGFLWDSMCDTNTTRYFNISDVKRILPKEIGKSKFSLMADYIDLQHLEDYDGTIEFIRLSFKRWRLDWGLKTAKILMQKGYKVFINPVNSNVYSDIEYIEVLQKVNELHPYGFSIVDTFGTMRVHDLTHRYMLVENNLLKDIAIGVHLHENMGLAYSLAQHMTQISSPKRKIVIDGSLLGMGRVPGNLCIEQFMDYMNNQFGEDYLTEPVYDAIDDYIAPIKAKMPWGYAIPYALSAKFNLHRTYAEYLMKKNRLKTKDIQRILGQVDKAESETFNEKYINKLYLDYMNVSYDDSKDLNNIKQNLLTYKKILVIAPGKSINEHVDLIHNVIDKETCVISINFVTKIFMSNYVFLTNTKRYDEIKNIDKNYDLVITSNLIRDVKEYDNVVSYNDLTYFKEEYCDDSTTMLLKLLINLGINEVYIAGFDGYKNGVQNFCNDVVTRTEMENTRENTIKNILKNLQESINIFFVTPSQYVEK